MAVAHHHIPYRTPLQVSENAIDSDAVKVFDKNGDGQTERSDWSAPFGDMGPQGEVVKDYIFK